MSRIVVSGMGVVSAIGENVSECHTQLKMGRSGLRHAEYLDSKYASELLFGEVRSGNSELFQELELPRGKGLTRTDLLAIKAFRQAVLHSNLSEDEMRSSETALISATTVGGMSETEAIHADTNSNTEPSEFIDSYRSGAHTLQIARIHKMKGSTATINTACSSSANAIMIGARMIKSGSVRRAIVGGVDSLARYTVNGFNALQILSKQATRPFDADRDGLSLGEGAAYLVLEKEEELNGKDALAVISGYGNANDAFHASAMSPEAVGVQGAINKALNSAGISADAIGHINAHGTGTQNNDLTELTGMTELFADLPPFISTKGYTGHTLGAAGAIEAVFSILAIKGQEVFPSLNFSKPMPELSGRPQTQHLSNIALEHVLSNSFGFGGNCSSLIISRY